MENFFYPKRKLYRLQLPLKLSEKGCKPFISAQSLNPLKKLAGQTAIYGLSSIAGRFLNYLLVPLHTVAFAPDAFGVVTEMYAYVAFLVVLLTYGMETAYFRFVSRDGTDPQTVFSTAGISLVVTAMLFILLVAGFSGTIADALKYPDHSEYVLWFAVILGLDAMTAIPMAQLRQQNRAVRFVAANLTNVGVNVILNLFFLWVLLPDYPEVGVGFIFIANLVASGAKFALLVPEFRGLKAGFDKDLWRGMMRYAFPLLIAGFAGIINETLDRALLKWMLWNEHGETYTMTQIGIYGACYKLSILITLFIQAFRFAAEPFFFAQAKESAGKQVYVIVMNYFVAVIAAMFLMVMLYIDLFKGFIPNEDYWVGLKVVPILLLANVFLGIYYNQSIWYKLSDKTGFGALIAILGAIITIVLNLLLIPELGYMGSAWATLACYASMSIISWLLGQRHYPIPYDLKKIALYLGSAIGLFILADWMALDGATKWVVHSLLFVGFAAAIAFAERSSYKKLTHGGE